MTRNQLLMACYEMCGSFAVYAMRRELLVNWDELFSVKPAG